MIAKAAADASGKLHVPARIRRTISAASTICGSTRQRRAEEGHVLGRAHRLARSASAADRPARPSPSTSRASAGRRPPTSSPSIYDNAYIGYACGFNSQGTVDIALQATGEPGWHFIDLYPAVYKGKEGAAEQLPPAAADLCRGSPRRGPAAVQLCLQDHGSADELNRPARPIATAPLRGRRSLRSPQSRFQIRKRPKIANSAPVMYPHHLALRRLRKKVPARGIRRVFRRPPGQIVALEPLLGGVALFLVPSAHAPGRRAPAWRRVPGTRGSTGRSGLRSRPFAVRSSGWRRSVA